MHSWSTRSSKQTEKFDRELEPHDRIPLKLFFTFKVINMYTFTFLANDQTSRSTQEKITLHDVKSRSQGQETVTHVSSNGSRKLGGMRSARLSGRLAPELDVLLTGGGGP